MTVKERVKEFWKRHKNKIFVGGMVVVGGVTIYIITKKMTRGTLSAQGISTSWRGNFDVPTNSSVFYGDSAEKTNESTAILIPS